MQGVQKIFMAPIYGAHCAVIFATAQLSCCTQLVQLSYTQVTQNIGPIMETNIGPTWAENIGQHCSVTWRYIGQYWPWADKGPMLGQ